MLMKICSKCKIEKSENFFHKAASKKDGLASSCKECVRAQNAEWYAKNSIKVNARCREWYAKNSIKVNARCREWRVANRVESRAKHHEWRSANPHLVRAQGMKKYGLTLGQFDEMVLNQGGVCAICDKESIPKNRSLSIDHCHTTGKVRGLLCRKCNAGLGQFNDSSELLEKAVKYMRAAC